MDIRCPKCGEPWDIDELHELDDMDFKTAYRKFQKVGCEVFDTDHGEVNETAAALAQAAYEVLGDDVDGAASMLDDAQSMGMMNE